MFLRNSLHMMEITLQTVSKVVIPFASPSAVCESSISSTSLPKCGSVHLFHVSQSNRYVVASHCGFNFAFTPVTKGVVHLCMCFSSIIFGKGSPQTFSPFII